MKMQFSSGGVIYRKVHDSIEIALVAVKGGSVWTLPKGIVNKGEKPEETSVREVLEETGLNGRLIEKIGETTYWYFLKEENAKVKKTVYYYLLEYVSGDTSDHDWEVDDAAWFPIDEALRRVSYKGDKDMIVKVREMITAVPPAGGACG
ncbi:MAG: NUDIX hydrolase [Thermodesulfovibrionales bacterium]|nr:NUDIX hydrolase [Thermodesulfovibrionales bacterium]